MRVGWARQLAHMLRALCGRALRCASPSKPSPQWGLAAARPRVLCRLWARVLPPGRIARACCAPGKDAGESDEGEDFAGLPTAGAASPSAILLGVSNDGSDDSDDADYDPTAEPPPSEARSKGRVLGSYVNGVWGRAPAGSGAEPRRGAGRSPAEKIRRFHADFNDFPKGFRDAQRHTARRNTCRKRYIYTR